MPRSTAWSGPSKPSSSSFDSRVSLGGVAAPRTSVEPPTEFERPRREGLSVQTLMVAALASGVAAVVVSRIWDKGTIVASAMTPVIVAIVSEAIRRPMESERVRRPVRAVASGVRPRTGRTPTVIAPPAPDIDQGLQQRDEGVEPGPVRVYGSGSAKRVVGRRRKLPFKLAIVTGLIGFVIAAAALTLPELIFGGSVVGGQRDTTYFGGGGGSSATTRDKKATDQQSTDKTTPQQTTTDTTPSTPTTTGTQTTPAPSGSPPPTTTGQTAPPPSTSTTPAPTPSVPAPTPPTP